MHAGTTHIHMVLGRGVSAGAGEGVESVRGTKMAHIYYTHAGNCQGIKNKVVTLTL